MSDLEKRIASLEAINSIENLKHTYLNACDAKDVEAMMSTFKEGSCHIDYGEVGLFNNREDLAKLFETVACHDHMVESHHAHNPIIDLIDNQNAKGVWQITYNLINTKDHTMNTLHGTYEDEYINENNHWVISKTIFKAKSTLQTEIKDQLIKVIFSGKP